MAREARERKATADEARAATPSICLDRIRIDCVTEAQVVQRIMSDLERGRGGWVVTPNVDQLRILSERVELREMIDEVDLMIADGMPLVWASRIQGTPLPARVAGASLILGLTQAAARTGASIFLLGGSPGAAEAAAVVMQRDNPALKVAGISCPPMGFDQDPVAMGELRAALTLARPDIVYVCLGFPKQELVARELRATLPQSWFLGLGGSLSMVAGDVSRAPIWMQDVGLEWLWRLLKEPRRLFERYIVHDLPFAARLLAGAIRYRFTAAHYDSDQRC
jgi:N-acetylglucosaminyldiphosphoundecaprenol N-acetyl-beta-D-mannosaminyltransferase